MDETVYIFDTNIISGLLHERQDDLLERIRQDQVNVLVLCDPIIYEVERGLVHKQARNQLQRFQEDIIPLFKVISLTLRRCANPLPASPAGRGGVSLLEYTSAFSPTDLPNDAPDVARTGSPFPDFGKGVGDGVYCVTSVISVQLVDWQVASRLWANARRDGKQLSAVDLLLAAISLRLKGILVTDDGDFDYIPLINTENWLQNKRDGEES